MDTRLAIYLMDLYFSLAFANLLYNAAMRKLIYSVILIAVAVISLEAVILYQDLKRPVTDTLEPSPTQTTTPTPYPPLNQDRLFELVQTWRVQNKLPKYQQNEALCQVAQMRAEDIQTNWSHKGFYEFADELKRTKPQFAGTYSLGENLAQDYLTEEEALEGWLNSPSHLKNLKAPYQFSCIRCVNGHCAHLFASVYWPLCCWTTCSKTSSVKIPFLARSNR